MKYQYHQNLKHVPMAEAIPGVSSPPRSSMFTSIFVLESLLSWQLSDVFERFCLFLHLFFTCSMAVLLLSVGGSQFPLQPASSGQ